jgi:predicted alpha/beta-hydrolase family hydrolase
MSERDEVRIAVPDSGRVSGILRIPVDASALLVLAHGAGAGMRHPFMERIADELATRRVATLRYQFPYMEAGRRRPDRAAVAEATVRAAVAEGRSVGGGLPVYAGGKSFGGRMTSQAAAKEPITGVAGLVFLGFPLHASGRPGTERAAHLADVDLPMLFVQGTRDGLADLDLLRPVAEGLGDRATLHVVEGGDHSFKVLKRSGRSEDEVFAEIGDAVARFTGVG